MKRVYLIRHARARDRETWRRSDALRPLTPQGWAQAAALPRLLGIPPKRILTSPATRCVETVIPLADALGLRPLLSASLAEGASAKRALALLARPGVSPVAYCTHGDIIDRLLELLVEAGVHLPGGPRLAKGSTWVLDNDQRGRVRRARYIPAP